MRGLAAGLRRWLPAAVFVLLNLGVLAAYYLVYSGRAADRVARYDRLTSTRQQLGAERDRLERVLARLENAQAGLDEFYGERLGTEGERLTGVIAEIRDLARTAGLEPSAINYTLEPLEDHGMVRRALNFTVAGRYLDLRRLINLLELSSFFITLDRVGLTEGGQGVELRISLELSALFAQSGAVPPVPVASGRRAG